MMFMYLWSPFAPLKLSVEWVVNVTWIRLQLCVSNTKTNKQMGVTYHSPRALRSPGALGSSVLTSHPGSRELRPCLSRWARALLPRSVGLEAKGIVHERAPHDSPLHHKPATSGSGAIKLTLLPPSKGCFPQIF